MSVIESERVRVRVDFVRAHLRAEIKSGVVPPRYYLSMFFRCRWTWRGSTQVLLANFGFETFSFALAVFFTKQCGHTEGFLR